MFAVTSRSLLVAVLAAVLVPVATLSAQDGKKTAAPPRVVVLGISQDGGTPQAGT